MDIMTTVIAAIATLAFGISFGSLKAILNLNSRLEELEKERDAQ